jgi:hypothetical protein
VLIPSPEKSLRSKKKRSEKPHRLMEVGHAATMQDKPLQNGCHLATGSDNDDGNPPPERVQVSKPVELAIKTVVAEDDDDPPAERLDKPANGNGTASGVDSGLDKSDSSESDASSTKSDDGGKDSGTSTSSPKKCEDDKEADVFFLPEVGFNIKIDAPGTENFEIQVSLLQFYPLPPFFGPPSLRSKKTS